MILKKNLNPHSNTQKISFSLALGILTFIFSNVALTSIAFLLHGSVSIIWLIISTLSSLFITYWALRKSNTPRPLIWVVALLSIFIVSIFLSSQSMDSTWDGNDYHKTAIGEMRDGWNPVWEKMIDFHNSPRNPLYSPEAEGEFRDYLTNWTDHYPKASWIFAANIYSLTGNIESGKAITMLSIVMLFCFALSLLTRLIGINKSVILASILSFNPVVMTQLFNYYNDGLLGNFLISLILLFTMLLYRSKDYVHSKTILLFTIFMLITTMVNFKFSALAYAGIVSICYYIYILFKRDKQLIKTVTLTGIASIIFGVLIIGASSYVVNTYRNQHPLFPLAGEGKIDIMAIQQPVGYAEKLGIRKFIENNLYATSNISYDPSESEKPRYKIPFTFDLRELAVLHGTSDARQGGYGVWFGGILIVSAATALYLAIKYARRYSKRLALLILPIASIAITVLIFDNTWWARYLPQLIVFPAIVVLILFILKIKVVPYVLIYLLLFNVTLTGLLELHSQAGFVKYSRDETSKNLVCSPENKTVVGYGRFYGALYNIRDLCGNISVSHKLYDDIPKEKTALLYYQTYVIKE